MGSTRGKNGSRAASKSFRQGCTTSPGAPTVLYSTATNVEKLCVRRVDPGNFSPGVDYQVICPPRSQAATGSATRARRGFMRYGSRSREPAKAYTVTLISTVIGSLRYVREKRTEISLLGPGDPLG